VLATAALTDIAGAQVTSAQQNAIRAACRSDFRAKCSGVTPGGKNALVCLQKNVESLSPSCKTAVSATLPPPAPAAAAPAAPPPVAPKTTEAPAAPPAPAATAAAPPPATATPAKPTAAKPATPPRQAAAALARPAAAPAQPTAAQQSAIRSACRSDFKSHCSGVTPGGKDALVCLQKNAAALAPACQKAVSAVGAPAPAAAATVAVAPPAPAPQAPRAPLVNAAMMLRACKLDLIRHCEGVNPGGGRELACLAAHNADLTFRCRTAMKVTAPLR
jgi:hypothetical protein